MNVMLISLACFLCVIVVLGAGFVAAHWAPERDVASLQPRWAPPPSTFLDVAGMAVHLRDEGPRDDESPVVLLHGSGSSLHAFDGWAQALAAERRVIRFDLPGFGLTGPSPENIYTIDHDTCVLINLLDELGVTKCVLAGASLGGAVAWRTALAHPSRVEKLILVGAAGYPKTVISQPIGYKLLTMPGIPWLLQNTLPRFLVVQGFRNAWGDPEKVTTEMVERSIELTQRAGNRRAIIERFRQFDPGAFAAEIQQLKLPTLIIWGGKDRLIPPDHAHRFHHDIEGSTLAIFDELGHAPEEEDPAMCLPAITEFLDARRA
jgi:pimeloyl-ACP methyl ester carboxylesterase